MNKSVIGNISNVVRKDLTSTKSLYEILLNNEKNTYTIQALNSERAPVKNDKILLILGKVKNHVYECVYDVPFHINNNHN